MEYAAVVKRLGEYAVDARYNRPRKKAYLRMERIRFGIMIDLAVAKRPIARKVIAASSPTSMKLQKSTCP
jgi:hypothetical protein